MKKKLSAVNTLQNKGCNNYCDFTKSNYFAVNTLQNKGCNNKWNKKKRKKALLIPFKTKSVTTFDCISFCNL